MCWSVRVGGVLGGGQTTAQVTAGIVHRRARTRPLQLTTKGIETQHDGGKGGAAELGGRGARGWRAEGLCGSHPHRVSCRDVGCGVAKLLSLGRHRASPHEYVPHASAPVTTAIPGRTMERGAGNNLAPSGRWFCKIVHRKTSQGGKKRRRDVRGASRIEAMNRHGLSLALNPPTVVASTCGGVGPG